MTGVSAGSRVVLSVSGLNAMRSSRFPCHVHVAKFEAENAGQMVKKPGFGGRLGRCGEMRGRAHLVAHLFTAL